MRTLSCAVCSAILFVVSACASHKGSGAPDGGTGDGAVLVSLDSGGLVSKKDGAVATDAGKHLGSDAGTHDAGKPAVCTGHACGAHSTCADVSGKAVCQCDSGFQDNDDNGSCTADCSDSSCGGHGQCAATSGAVVCACDAGWSGAACAAADCAGITCSSHGTCDASSGAALCACTSGWSGADCSTADCADVTCSGQGTCAVASGAAVCTCALGWSGAACATADCTGVTCSGRGTCAVANAAAVCTCALGWSGAACATADCTGITCSGQGTCAVTSGAAVCTCASGWSGAACATADCTGVTCSGQGTCAVTNGAAVCTCALGWSGVACATGDCTGVTCSGQGTCGVTNGAAVCTCALGWSGAACATPDCTGVTCSGQGTCAVTNGAAVCTCALGWSGAACATADCTGVTCNSHGTCATTTGAAVCTCAADWAGADCGTPDCVALNGRACVHGSCDGSTGTVMCKCDTGNVGALCDQCDTAAGYQDYDSSGTCDPPCGGGVCDGLHAARGLSTGLHTLTLQSGPAPIYIDGDYDGGGWILIGRGRENWAWTNQGAGTPSDVGVGVGTTDAFVPKYLATVSVQSLITHSLGTIDLKAVEVRLHRAADTMGTAYQDVHWHFTQNTEWDWNFPTVHQTVDQVVDSSVLGAGASVTGDVYDIGLVNGLNDQTRVFTWSWVDHGNMEGFSYGQAIVGGDNTPTNFFWEYMVENHSMPYTEVYVRLPICKVDTCTSHFACDQSAGLPNCSSCSAPYTGSACDSCAPQYQDNNCDGTCEPSCTVGTCTVPGEYCAGSTGGCKPVAGTSCLDIHTMDSTTVDGAYVIDPDGSGALPPIGVDCDMTTAGGGWTVISKENFECGTAPGWSDGRVDTTSTCATAYSKMLGGYGLFGVGADTQRVYDLQAVVHTEAYVSLDYVVLDSWDSENAVVNVYGANVFNMSYNTSNAPSNACGGPWNDYGAQAVTSQSANTINTLTLDVTTTLDQDPTDESFGVDNVRVMIR